MSCGFKWFCVVTLFMLPKSFQAHAQNNGLSNSSQNNSSFDNLSHLETNPAAAQLKPQNSIPPISNTPINVAPANPRNQANSNSSNKASQPQQPQQQQPHENAAPRPLGAPVRQQRASEFVDPHDPDVQIFEGKVTDQIKSRVQAELLAHCPDYCQLLAIRAEVGEAFDNTGSQLGFENTVGSQGNRRFFARKVTIDVMLDDRFGQQNSRKLKALMLRLTDQYPYPSEYRFIPVVFPDGSETARAEAEALGELTAQIKSRLGGAVAQYCPQECEVLAVDAEVTRVPLDEVQSGSAHRYLTPRGLRGALYVRGLKVTGAFNALMEPLRKSRIESVFRELLKGYGFATLNMQEVAFPKSAQEVQKDLDESRSDPFGLEKMARALKIFKEHANTKEIIKETTQTQKEERTNSKDREIEKSALEKSHKESAQSSTSNSQNSNSQTSQDSSWITPEKLWLIGGVLIALIVAASLGLYFIVNGKRTQAAVAEAHRAGAGGLGDGDSVTLSSQGNPGHVVNIGGMTRGSTAVALGEQVKMRLDAQRLKEELLEAFLLQPKLARYLFRRVIRENGIEYASKCMIILGENVVFESLNEEDLKNDLSTLAEYVHVNTPSVSDEEQFEILKHLKLKVSAGKLHQKASHSLDMFDFLKSKSPQQIFELIHDESPQSQAIVLTQLPGQKRRSVFDLFEGTSKIKLLKELSSGDAVPRHYLVSVAQAFQRKASKSPRFDAELVRGTDVLLELIERADLGSQREIMAELDRSNPDASWLLRSKIVTIETLGFLRDNLLVDIFLSLDPNDMTVLLAGTRDHVRDLILNKAPGDLADVWQENLQSMRSVDPEVYKLAELQVISRLRSLIAAGSINLMEVNQLIYPTIQADDPGEFGESGQAEPVAPEFSNRRHQVVA